VTVLACAECGCVARASARGWKAYLAGDLDEEDDEEIEVVCLCPSCAEREFGSQHSLGS
jgi:hypothetical protein